MHKSAYKLRFFLMALILPTVGAEIPIGNMNLFENAMAITPEYNYDNYSSNNNNSYEDMYSKYPTKDVACQTGQFEGFFVESVEFCKLTIAQGPEGPPGQNATQVTVNNIRDVVTNQTLQCVLNTRVDPAPIDCALPPESTTTTLSVSLTIDYTPVEVSTPVIETIINNIRGYLKGNIFGPNEDFIG